MALSFHPVRVSRAGARSAVRADVRLGSVDRNRDCDRIRAYMYHAGNDLIADFVAALRIAS